MYLPLEYVKEQMNYIRFYLPKDIRKNFVQK